MPGQAESRTARAELDEWLKAREKAAAWEDGWRELMGERVPRLGPEGELVLNERGQAKTKLRWTWRKALAIAWFSVPKWEREPPTLEGLAQLLGLKSASAIRNWRRRDPEFAEAPYKFTKRRLLEHLADVDAAHIAVATSPDPKATAERRLYYERVGELGQSGAMAVAVATGGQVEVAGLTDAELEAIAAGGITRGSSRGSAAPAEGA